MSKNNLISRRRKKLRNLLKRHIMEQDNKCCYCGEEFSDERKNSRSTLEHVKSRSEFLTTIINEDGTERRFVPIEADSYENTAAACWGCNNKRGDIPHEIFKELELWKHERRKQLWLWKLRMDFLRVGSIKILKSMARFHDGCAKGWATR